MPASLELEGKTFGRLHVLARDGRTNAGKIRWLCECSCNPEKPVEVLVIGSKLVGGWTKSCGCIQREAAAKTGNRYAHLLVHGARKPVRKTDRSPATIPLPENDHEHKANTL